MHTRPNHPDSDRSKTYPKKSYTSLTRLVRRLALGIGWRSGISSQPFLHAAQVWKSTITDHGLLRLAVKHGYLNVKYIYKRNHIYIYRRSIEGYSIEGKKSICIYIYMFCGNMFSWSLIWLRLLPLSDFLMCLLLFTGPGLFHHHVVLFDAIVHVFSGGGMVGSEKIYHMHASEGI